MIDTIMLFAAGLGSRMRHLTKNNPKSLINILDKSILYHALELCNSYPFKRIIINTHYLSKQIEQALSDFRIANPDFPEIKTIYEEELLETGGAIKNAINLLGDKPIFTLNTDIVIKCDYNIFNIMISEWNPDRMDFLLLLQNTSKAVGSTRHGDFDLDLNGKLIRNDKASDYDYVYTGLQILKPNNVANHPLKIFSLREYHLNSQKVRGMVLKNVHWYHAKCPEDIVDIEMDILGGKNA